jgi:DNA-binding LacI/PurR family transcriptional regulator
MVEAGLIHALAVNARLSEEEIATLWSWGLPMVVIGRRYRAQYPGVLQDSQAAAEAIFDRLRDHACRRVTVVSTVESRPHDGAEEPHVMNRLADLLAAGGLAVPEDRVFRAAQDDVTPADGYHAAKQVLTAAPGADSLVACGTPLSLGAREYLKETGRLGQPGFTFVAISDQDPIDGAATLALPVAELGRQAAGLLQAQIRDGRQSHVRLVRVPMAWMPPGN